MPQCCRYNTLCHLDTVVSDVPTKILLLQDFLVEVVLLPTLVLETLSSLSALQSPQSMLLSVRALRDHNLVRMFLRPFLD